MAFSSASQLKLFAFPRDGKPHLRRCLSFFVAWFVGWLSGGGWLVIASHRIRFVLRAVVLA